MNRNKENIFAAPAGDLQMPKAGFIAAAQPAERCSAPGSQEFRGLIVFKRLAANGQLE